MSQDRYIYLIYKELNDTLIDSERNELQQWLDASTDHVAQKQDIIKTLADLDDQNPGFDVDLEAEYTKVATSLGLGSNQELSKNGTKPKTGNRAYLWILLAAFLTGIGAAALYYNSQKTDSPVYRAFNAGDEKQEVQLADGSIIKLNAGSTLEYPEEFVGETRNVKLQGEAFFDIKRDESKPFIITTTQSRVEVLGTSFNIREDQLNSNTTIAVLSGKVRLTSAFDDSKSLTLVKNQKGTVTKEHKLLKEDNENLNALAWSSGKLRFKSSPIGDVFGDMAAFYDVSIINKSDILEDCTYSMSGQEISLDRLLENMNQIFNFDIERKSDNVVLISGGDCK